MQLLEPQQITSLTKNGTDTFPYLDLKQWIYVALTLVSPVKPQRKASDSVEIPVPVRDQLPVVQRANPNIQHSTAWLPLARLATKQRLSPIGPLIYGVFHLPLVLTSRRRELHPATMTVSATIPDILTGRTAGESYYHTSRIHIDAHLPWWDAGRSTLSKQRIWSKERQPRIGAEATFWATARAKRTQLYPIQSLVAIWAAQ